MTPEGEQTLSASRRGPVVVGVDGSASALQAVRWAAAEAARRGAVLRLVATYAVPAGRPIGDPGLGMDYRAAVRGSALAHLATAAHAVGEVAPALTVEQAPVEGFPAAVLQGESHAAALVVLGDRGLGGFTGLLIGSVAVALAAHAACPVVVVRGPEPGTSAVHTGPVVVGVDGSPAGEAAVGFAFEAAAMRAVPLVAVHTWQDLLSEATRVPRFDLDAVAADENQVLAEQLAGWSEKYPDVTVRRLVVRDRPAHALVQESARAQLVVVGSRGLGGLAGMLLGSVSHAVLHHARSPVAVVRPPTPTAGAQ
jgi:nucleotide-binding universal stress UspA family protein